MRKNIVNIFLHHVYRLQSDWILVHKLKIKTIRYILLVACYRLSVGPCTSEELSGDHKHPK